MQSEVNVGPGRKDLEEIADRLSETDADNAEGIEEVLKALGAAEADMSSAVVDSVPLSRLGARAEENIALAQDALGSDGAEALARAERALDLLQLLEEETADSTRAQDEIRNQQQFMSG